MVKVHRLLARQLSRCKIDLPAAQPALKNFVAMVNDTYNAVDTDRNMLERSLELSSQELLQANSEMRAILEAFPDRILWIDAQGEIKLLKDGWIKAVNNGSGNVLIGTNIKDLPFCNQSIRTEKAIELALESGNIVIMEYESRSEAGINYFEARFVHVTGDNIIVICRDITQRKLVDNRILYLTRHDELTGLCSRRFFLEEVERIDKTVDRVGIVSCDLDGLKIVNDSLGHDMGDTMLIQAAAIIKESFTQADLIARLGGDEFTVLLTDREVENLPLACSRLQSRLREYNQKASLLPISMSLGFAFRENTETRLSNLMKEADDNMYRTKLHNNKSVRSSIVQALMKALEERDFMTQGHGQRLNHIITHLAAQFNYPSNRMSDLSLFAEFHDIGKVGISDKILFKDSPLNRTEKAEVNRHSEIGYRIALSSRDLAPIADWILYHHEWWNGEGYPVGLKGQDIPLECRIIAVADAFDAMINDRPYRRSMSVAQALTELQRGSGTQFDPAIVEIFTEYIVNCPDGTISAGRQEKVS